MSIGGQILMGLGVLFGVGGLAMAVWLFWSTPAPSYQSPEDTDDHRNAQATGFAAPALYGAPDVERRGQPDPFGVGWVLENFGPRNDDDTRAFEKARARINLLRRYVHDETPALPETPAPPREVLELLCAMRLHWSGSTDRGLHGDRWKCDHCKADKYPEVFPGKILYPREGV